MSPLQEVPSAFTAELLDVAFPLPLDVFVVGFKVPQSAENATVTPLASVLFADASTSTLVVPLAAKVVLPNMGLAMVTVLPEIAKSKVGMVKAKLDINVFSRFHQRSKRGFDQPQIFKMDSGKKRGQRFTQALWRNTGHSRD